MNKFVPVKGQLLHHTCDYKIRRGKKSEFNDAGYEINIGRPWEMQYIKTLGAPPPKPVYNKEKLFDVKQDGKPIKKDKRKKDWEMRKPWMLDQNKVKQYHYQ
tara:strand:+ start:9225 stop:9530 length:306 start_codon:yes stop_codon:yes gene_type:complete